MPQSLKVGTLERMGPLPLKTPCSPGLPRKYRVPTHTPKRQVRPQSGPPRQTLQARQTLPRQTLLPSF